MSYTTVKFLLFILIVFASYFAAPKKYRWVVLALSSLYFYLGVGWRAFCFIATSTVTTYLGALSFDSISGRIKECKKSDTEDSKARLKKLNFYKKAVIALVILLNLGILGYVKYAHFVANNLNQLFEVFSFDFSLTTQKVLMPLGLSFYTFQIVGYMLDVSHEKHPAERNFFKYFLFVTFFPQIIQGPISRYSQLAPQLYEGHDFDWNRVYDGIILIMWGFFKKMVIADRAAIFANTVFSAYWNYAGVQTFLGLFFYGIQLYADFSGGIDITRGIAQVMGIDMVQNFNHPFFAKSVSEYWNRWHMSLGSWMRDYVFYSMRSVKFIAKATKKTNKIFGKKIGKNIPSAIVTVICFLLIGIWHDASWNYVAFGLVNGFIVGSSTVLKPYYKKILETLHITKENDAWKAFRMIRTFLICMVLRVSHSGSFRASYAMVTSLFRQIRLSTLFDGSLKTSYGLTSTDYHILLFACTIFFVVSIVSERGVDVREWIRKQGFFFKFLVAIFLILTTMMFAVLENNLVGGFLYAQF